MSTNKKLTVETTKTRTFANGQEARAYARALASHGQISRPELRSVERATQNAEKPHTQKKR